MYKQYDIYWKHYYRRLHWPVLGGLVLVDICFVIVSAFAFITEKIICVIGGVLSASTEDPVHSLSVAHVVVAT